MTTAVAQIPAQAMEEEGPVGGKRHHKKKSTKEAKKRNHTTHIILRITLPVSTENSSENQMADRRRMANEYLSERFTIAQRSEASLLYTQTRINRTTFRRRRTLPITTNHHTTTTTTTPLQICNLNSLVRVIFP